MNTLTTNRQFRETTAYAGVAAGWSVIVLLGLWCVLSQSRFDVKLGVILLPFLFSSVFVGFFFRPEFKKQGTNSWAIGTAALALNAVVGTLWAPLFCAVVARFWPTLLSKQDLHWSVPVILFGGWFQALSQLVWTLPVCVVLGSLSFQVMKWADTWSRRLGQEGVNDA
jgi:hypothetical protein